MVLYKFQNTNENKFVQENVKIEIALIIKNERKESIKTCRNIM